MQIDLQSGPDDDYYFVVKDKIGTNKIMCVREYNEYPYIYCVFET